MRNSKPMIVFGIAFFLACGLLWWMYEASLDPVVTIPPHPPLPSPNAYDYFHQAEIMMTSVPSYDPTLPLADRETAVAAEDECLAIIREGLTYPYTAKRLLIYSHIIELFRVEASVREDHGDISGAVASHLDGMRVGIMVPRGGSMRDYHDGVNAELTAAMDLWRLVSRCDATGAKRAVTQLEELRAQRVPYREPLTREKHQSQQQLLEKFQRMHESEEHAAWKLLSCGGKRRIMAELTAYWDHWIADAQKPYAQRTLAPWPKSRFFNHKDGTDRICYINPGDDPWIVNFSESYAKTQTAMLTIAFALRVYYLEHGTYPETLDELVPEYLSTVPSDPFSGTSFHYARTGETYILYSVGPDGKDDGGTPSTNGQAKLTEYVTDSVENRLDITSTGDIVAGVNRY